MRVLALSAVLTALLSGGFRAVAAQQETEFRRLLQEYRSGDADRALLEFSTWSEERVRRDARFALAAQQSPWDRAAWMLFHAEAGQITAAGWRTRYDDILESVNWLYREGKNRQDRGLLEFVRDFRLLQLPGLTTINVYVDLRDWFPDDALVQLALGARMEYAMPRVEAVSGGYGFGDENIVHVTSHGRFGPEGAEAMLRFRRTLDLDPAMTEARVRLGRVLCLLDRRDEARRELERAQQDAVRLSQPGPAYLASLFLGGLHEELKQTEAAVQAYRAAIDAYPAGQSARIALGRLLVSVGQERDGWTTASLLPVELEAGRPPDPWTTYQSAQRGGPELRARYRALRPFIRQ